MTMKLAQINRLRNHARCEERQVIPEAIRE